MLNLNKISFQINLKIDIYFSYNQSNKTIDPFNLKIECKHKY